MMDSKLEPAWLDRIFPPERSDEFFDALYGGAEEGAYDIALRSRAVTAVRAVLAFELRQRPGKCLKCNLTYGLPRVFERHPVLKVAQVAGEIAAKLGFGENFTWKLGETTDCGPSLHEIPLIIDKGL